MNNIDIFHTEKELTRLNVQKGLLLPVERPILSELFSGRSGLRVLDIGCNDGVKTAAWFSVPEVSRVIGLEYNESLVESANSRFGGERFSFFGCDANADDFPQQLHRRMEETGISGFDLIYLSFFLCYLKDPDAVVELLLTLLAPGGHMLIVEADDGRAELRPEGNGLLQEFLRILGQDRYAGNRKIGGRLIGMLDRCGAQDIRLRCHALAGSTEEKKQELFTMFLSYLPDDVAMLREEEPENPLYAEWENWLAENYEALQRAVLKESSELSMGMAVITCTS